MQAEIKEGATKSSEQPNPNGVVAVQNIAHNICPWVIVSSYLEDIRSCVRIDRFKCVARKGCQQDQINKVEATKSIKDWCVELAHANINQCSGCLF